ncbi:hypothetical protein DPMN_104531 [Dreissena polymorpha]|uniref:Uncharacterized protein n=1 Tax=Dreissena polymorpha TaxID=45954 RepID=A0A9D4HDB7_DREPO|nr:hypothetical protein DPMN_104531 [Dreissena polymorpha]
MLKLMPLPHSYISVQGCTFPADFKGAWTTTVDGEILVNATHMFNYPIVSRTSGQPFKAGYSRMNFSCVEKQDSKYLLR